MGSPARARGENPIVKDEKRGWTAVQRDTKRSVKDRGGSGRRLLGRGENGSCSKGSLFTRIGKRAHLVKAGDRTATTEELYLLHLPQTPREEKGTEGDRAQESLL